MRTGVSGGRAAAAEAILREQLLDSSAVLGRDAAGAEEREHVLRVWGLQQRLEAGPLLQQLLHTGPPERVIADS